MERLLEKSLDPDWAIPAHDFVLLDYPGLEALSAHFPSLDAAYKHYQSLNNRLTRFHAVDVTIDGKHGRKPTTDDGVAALQERNDAARLVVAELDKIQGLKSITVGCTECEGNGSDRPAIIGKET